jgi:hypothetical protein
MQIVIAHRSCFFNSPDEMLNMGFAEDVETILDGVGSKNAEKTQCLLFRRRHHRG